MYFSAWAKSVSFLINTRLPFCDNLKFAFVHVNDWLIILKKNIAVSLLAGSKCTSLSDNFRPNSGLSHFFGITSHFEVDVEGSIVSWSIFRTKLSKQPWSMLLPAAKATGYILKTIIKVDRFEKLKMHNKTQHNATAGAQPSVSDVVIGHFSINANQNHNSACQEAVFVWRYKVSTSSPSLHG